MCKIIQEIIKIRQLSKSTKGLSLPKKISKFIEVGSYIVEYNKEKNQIIIDLKKII